MFPNFARSSFPQPAQYAYNRSMAQPSVLITGASKRLGAEMARCFGAAGYHVVIHAREACADAAALAASLPSAECVHADLLDGDAAVAMVRELAARLPNWRVLINSAAVFHYDDGAALDPALFAEAMAVNAATPIRMAQAFLAHSNPQNSRRIINITDMKLANPNPDFASYTMAKHALAAATKMLAQSSLHPADRIYALAPGAMLPSFDQHDHEHESSGRMNLLARLTTPAELAEAALWLAQGWLASGETLFVDSGQHLLSQPRDVLYLARQ
jgi:NAD(P)-dependent dehydrogenase (short-subunit alcohol dehydrogenase family)